MGCLLNSPGYIGSVKNILCIFDCLRSFFLSPIFLISQFYPITLIESQYLVVDREYLATEGPTIQSLQDSTAKRPASAVLRNPKIILSKPSVPLASLPLTELVYLGLFHKRACY